MRNFVYNIPDDVKSSGTDLKESLYIFLLLNILDDVQGSGTNSKEPSCTIFFRIYQMIKKVAEQILDNHHAHFYR